MVSTALPKLGHASSSLKSLALVLFVDHSRSPHAHLRLVFSFFSLFLFFNRNFLGAAIKTDKVTLRTDQIVDSTSKLIDTSKTLFIFKRESSLLLNAPKGSFLHRLGKKQIEVLSGLSILKRMQTVGVDRYLFFNEEVLQPYLMGLQASHAKKTGLVGFVKPSGYYEALVSLRMRQSLDPERKRFINSRQGVYF